MVCTSHGPLQALNIYKVNDLLTRRGWHLNALQSPPALHFCFTAAHSPAVVEQLLLDLEQTVGRPGNALQAVHLICTSCA